MTGRIRDIGQEYLQSSFHKEVVAAPDTSKFSSLSYSLWKPVLEIYLFLCINYIIIIRNNNNNNGIIDKVMTDSKNLFCSSKFQGARERTSSKFIDNFGTGPRKKFASPGLLYFDLPPIRDIPPQTVGNKRWRHIEVLTCIF